MIIWLQPPTALRGRIETTMRETLQWIIDTCDQVIDQPDHDINATELPYVDLIDMITAIRAESFCAHQEAVSGGTSHHLVTT